MSFVSNSGIEDEMYGTYQKEKGKSKDDITYTFVPLGKAVKIEDIFENIEDNSVKLNVSFEYMGKRKSCTLHRSDIINKNKIDTLGAIGIDVSPHNHNVFLDTLRQQEHSMAKKQQITLVYEKLGWIMVPVYDNDGNVCSYKLCYRTDKMINHENSKYTGSFQVENHGNYNTWRQMVIDEIIGHIMPEFVLIASLSAIVVGALAMEISIDNPIVHFYYLSGRGKSTLAQLASSVIGQPFNGEITSYDAQSGTYITKRSILQSWGATSNAIILTNAGNRGVPTILDEFGKFNGKNLRELIFNFSEGTDKQRANQKLKVKASEGYNTTFLSFGETSLLEKCQDKLEGLNVRVMEINRPLTDSAEQARKIKAVCKEHYGWAIPMMAEYIISKGGTSYVSSKYKACINRLNKLLPTSEFSERVIEKFYAIFMTTAIIAKEALNIPFNISNLLEFFKENEKDSAKSRNISATSYESIIQYFNINLGNFYDGNRDIPNTSCWGRYTDKPVILDDGKVVVAEYSVRKNIVHSFLKNEGYQNKNACLVEWKANGFLDYEDGKNTRKRIIIPSQKNPEFVYVFRVFADEETKAEILEQEAKRLKREEEREKRRQAKIKALEEEIKEKRERNTDDIADSSANC